MIGIVDYGLGNLGSVQNMIKKVGGSSIILAQPTSDTSITKLVLSGVGSFDTAMQNLETGNWREWLDEMVLGRKVPILGICLGMQIMTESSEEGIKKGLGWIKGKTIKFRLEDKKLKIPHMGWNIVYPHEYQGIFANFHGEIRFYHVHSYHIVIDDPELELAVTNHGYPFTSAFKKDNIYGVQFHPEKSHHFGMQLYKNFLSI
jgi:imidazole glycerol-phosphate synthase subunit HisH